MQVHGTRLALVSLRTYAEFNRSKREWINDRLAQMDAFRLRRILAVWQMLPSIREMKAKKMQAAQQYFETKRMRGVVRWWQIRIIESQLKRCGV